MILKMIPKNGVYSVLEGIVSKVSFLAAIEKTKYQSDTPLKGVEPLFLSYFYPVEFFFTLLKDAIFDTFDTFPPHSPPTPFFGIKNGIKTVSKYQKKEDSINLQVEKQSMRAY